MRTTIIRTEVEARGKRRTPGFFVGPNIFSASVAFGLIVGMADVAAETVNATETFGDVMGFSTSASTYRLISVGPCDPVQQSGAPTIVGGDPSMHLSIGGIDFSLKHKEEFAQIQSQTIGRWTATCQLVDSSGAVATAFAAANGGCGLSIIIQEYGRKLFAGCIQSVVAQRYLGTEQLFTYYITATDKSSILDRRIVKKVLYPAAADGADVARDVIANYADGEGITVVNVPASLGSLDSDLPINYQTVTNVLNSIATLTATVWWVDVNGDLHFSALTDLPAAPFDLTETSYNWRGGTGGIAGGSTAQGSGGLSLTQTLQDFATEIIVVSNRNVIPPGGAGTSGPQTSETYTLPQPAAAAAGNPTGYIITMLNISTVVSITVNGVSKPVYSLDDPAAPPYGSVDAWYYQASGAQMVFPGFAQSAGEVVVVVYVPSSSNAAVTEGSALEPANPALGQCGSGRYQVVVQVQDITLRSDLDAIAAAYLAKYGTVPQVIDYETDYPGLQPGMLQNVNIPLIGVTNQKFLITQVTGQSVGSNLGHNGTFRWQVQMRNTQDPGNWVTYLNRLIRRTEQPKPIVQLHTQTYIISSGAAFGGGAPLGNPLPVQASGQLYRMTIGCGTAPVNQDLVVTWTVNNIPVGSITLPANIATNFFEVALFDPSKPIYVYSGDNASIPPDAFNLTATYQNIGASPAAAKNVTVTISVAV